MCHSEGTARSSYFLQEKSKNAGSASAAFCTILCEKAPAKKKKHENLIWKSFSEEIKKKNVTLAVVREKRATLSDLKHYFD